MQLVDILTGAICYRHNNPYITPQMNSTKVELVNRTITRSQINLTNTTLSSEDKLTCWCGSMIGGRPWLRTRWLPDLLPCDDLAQWEAYEDHLYEIFERDFLLTKPTFEGLPVNTRRHPMEHGREEAFWHITCCDYGKDGERQPDMNRCERIKYGRERSSRIAAAIAPNARSAKECSYGRLLTRGTAG